MSETEDEFRANVDQLTVDIMDLIYKNRPDLGTVANSILQILIGILMQTPKGELRDRMRQIMHTAIDDDSDREGVDMSERLQSAKH